MSITYSADIFCDECGNWTHGTTRGFTIPTHKEARSRAKERGGYQGWINIGNKDYCPDCVSSIPKLIKLLDKGLKK